jgi:arylsulfatase
MKAAPTRTFIAAALACALAFTTVGAQSADKPNIVLIFMDNLGWGDLGAYGGGILRGAPTPRIDQLAAEGMRLQNFNVETLCTPSRAALLTGRYAVRTGNGTVPWDTPLYGLVQWEYTMAEMLSDAGYATGMWGKWHLGHTKGRFSTDQGFDEWYGIPNSSDESYWPDNPLYRPDSHPGARPTHIMEGRKGSQPRQAKIYDLKNRALLDREITDRAREFMHRQVKARKPFFAYIPYTMVHMPVIPHPDFKDKTRNGVYADVLAQIDAYAGELLDTVDELGIRDNTIFIFTSDNGPPEMLPQQQLGSAGPWRGFSNTGLEGGIRAPFIIRWPGKVPSGVHNNEIVHEMDMLPTLARLVGGKVPTDRIIDGVDQTDFFLGKQAKSKRDGFVVYVGGDIFGVKWRDWKISTREVQTGVDPVQEFGIPRFYNLIVDPREERALNYMAENAWVRFPVFQILTDHLKSLKKEPPIKPGTPDPYVPPK